MIVALPVFLMVTVSVSPVFHASTVAVTPHVLGPGPGSELSRPKNAMA